MPARCCPRVTKTAASARDVVRNRALVNFQEPEAAAHRPAALKRKLLRVALLRVKVHRQRVAHVVQLPCRSISTEYSNGSLLFRTFLNGSTRICKRVSRELCFTSKRDEPVADRVVVQVAAAVAMS